VDDTNSEIENEDNTSTGFDIPGDVHYTVEYAAHMVHRSTDMLYRYIREGRIRTVQDPEDGRVRLIPSMELLKVLDQPKRGLRRRIVPLTLSDGTVIRKMIAMPKQEKGG
jgi:hypothetical protein